MDMVFVYEDKIAQDIDGNYYTGSSFSQLVFDRYLQHFDHIILFMRKASIDPHDKQALERLNRLDSDRIKVILLPDLNASLRNHLDPHVRAAFKSTILKQIKPGRAVIVRVPSMSGTIAADYCHKKGIPYLAEAVGCPWDSLWNHSLKGKLMAPFWWADMKRTMRYADYAVYVTNRFLQKRYPTNGKAAAISDVELQAADDWILNRRLDRIKSHGGKFVLGTAGALNVAYKGQRYIIEALAKMKRIGECDFEYHLVGGGDCSKLASLAKKLGVDKQVYFDGVLPHIEMFQWLDKLDVYIQPSTVESMPRALIEAMSLGLSCLGSSVGDIPYLLGYDVFQKGNVKQLIEKLLLVNDKWLMYTSERNYYFAKRFEKIRLDKERFQIFECFAEMVKEKYER